MFRCVGSPRSVVAPTTPLATARAASITSKDRGIQDRTEIILPHCHMTSARARLIRSLLVCLWSVTELRVT
jgi:hypothetical protein